MIKSKLHITHIITGLGNGGAENVLFHLVKNSDASIKHHVISLTSKGKYYDYLVANNIEVSIIGMHRGQLTLKGIIKLILLLRDLDTNIVQTWMYHADLIGGICAKFARKKNVIWNIRSAEISTKSIKFSTKSVIRICAFFSFFIPDKIISCSKRSIEVHKKLGFKDNFCYIPNGYDSSIFHKSLTQRNKVRKLWNLASNNLILIGMVARFDPQKDHMTLLKAFSLVHKKISTAKLIFIGRDMTQNNAILVSMIEQLGLKNSVKLFSESSNISGVMNALDIHVLSSSYGEGFPNTVLESMACGTPSIVTDVGDSAEIVKNIDLVVEPRNPEQLSETIIYLSELIINNSKIYTDYCLASNQRAKSEFNLKKMVDRYESIWNSLL